MAGEQQRLRRQCQDPLADTPQKGLFIAAIHVGAAVAALKDGVANESSFVRLGVVDDAVSRVPRQLEEFQLEGRLLL